MKHGIPWRQAIKVWPKSILLSGIMLGEILKGSKMNKREDIHESGHDCHKLVKTLW